MKIVCLGWGSLIWDARELPIIPEWHKDGPFAPVEFVRQSNDGRITLVLDKDSAPVRLLWAQMTSLNLEAAKNALKVREGMGGNNWEKIIGVWEKGQRPPEYIKGIDDWASSNSIDAAIWTALGAKFNGENQRPTSDQIVLYLQSLLGSKLDNARKYIECTPRQIDTKYRRDIEARLGWTWRQLA